MRSSRWTVARPHRSRATSSPYRIQQTGRQQNLTHPDCSVRVSDCHDLEVINTLDGFGLQPRLSIPFDGAIDPDSVHSNSVFLVGLAAAGSRIGINQVVWDPA